LFLYLRFRAERSVGLKCPSIFPHFNEEPKTVLKLVHDNRNLYFLFEVADANLVLAAPFADERSVEGEDRVGLLFSKDADMNEYYGFEIDPLGRCLSYKAQYYREFDYAWNPPEGFKAVGTRTATGYRIEGAIPLWFMNALRRYGGHGPMMWGAFRIALSHVGVEENWLSLYDPVTAKPDIHVPVSLRELNLR